MNARVKEDETLPHIRALHAEKGLDYPETDRILMSPIAAADIAEVHALECRVHAYPWSQTIISDCIDSAYECWMMKQSHRLIAYSIMTIGVGGSHLLNLCVDADFRRQGYACYMMQFLSDISIVRNAKRMFLEVRESNYRALSLYHKLGFQQISRRRNYYPTESDREAALVLAKLL